MVTIINYLERKTDQGKSFLVLELEGGLQVQKSQTTGNLYACKCKCTIPCTFDENTARELIGTTLPGIIIREVCEPYSFTNLQTGESVSLNYRYSYHATEGPSKASNPPMMAEVL